jgi:hypothetical protein
LADEQTEEDGVANRSDFCQRQLGLKKHGREVEMRIAKSFVAPVLALVLLLAGCGPASSLFPLFDDKSLVFDEGLIGRWVVQGEGKQWIFKSSDSRTYDFTLTDFEKNINLRSETRLVRLGKFLFIDFASPDAEFKRPTEVPFPGVPAHIFGRVWIEKDVVRLAMLDEDWVKNMAREKKLVPSYADTPDGVVLTASTEELQQFALEHAEDKEAFSDEYELRRQK